MIDALGKRYGQRPSDLIGGLSDVQAVSVDLAAMAEGVREEARAQRMAEQRARAKRG